jgi:predicted RNase H-like HicB family nuclease
MTEIVFLVEEDKEGGYTARALDHSIFTQAETWDELELMIEDAVRCHFDGDEEWG